MGRITDKVKRMKGWIRFGNSEMLMNQLFQGIQSTNDSLEEKIILPNLTGGYDLKSRSGEVVGVSAVSR